METLAVGIGVTRASISNWETGINHPREAAVEALTSFFDVSTREILKGDIFYETELNAVDIEKILDSDSNVCFCEIVLNSRDKRLFKDILKAIVQQ